MALPAEGVGAPMSLRLALLLLVLALSACQSAGGGKASPAAKQESVRFPGPKVTLSGELFLPAGGTPGKRHSAVILLHGCGGMYTTRGAISARDLDWARRFADWGYVALLPDSFGPRGHGSVCELKARDRPTQPWVERTADAYAALDYLASRSDVDPKNIFVMGWSHGGSTVVGVVRAGAPGLRADGPRFRAAIAYYPGCQTPLRAKNYRPLVPMLIQHGEADDWVPAAPCVKLAEAMQRRGYAVQTLTYPEAHHGFDSPNTKVRELPAVWNPNAKGERGAHVGTHPQARAKAIADTRAYVDSHLVR
jgi:dienelactone hydrolase